MGGTWRWFSWTGDVTTVLRDKHMRLPPSAPEHEVLDPPAAFVAVYCDPAAWSVPAMCSIVIRRRRLVEIGGMVDEFTGMYEDQVLYTKVLLQLAVVFDDRRLALYRQHPASACAVAERAGEYHLVAGSVARDRFITWLVAYVDAHCPADPAVGAVVAANVARRPADVADPPSDPGERPGARARLAQAALLWSNLARATVGRRRRLVWRAVRRRHLSRPATTA